MAAMALEGGGILLYRSIVNLSKLFQYTLRQEGDYLSFNKELDYVKSYLQLQNLRYEEHLQLLINHRHPMGSISSHADSK